MKRIFTGIVQAIKTLLLVAIGIAIWAAIFYAGLTGLASR